MSQQSSIKNLSPDAQSIIRDLLGAVGSLTSQIDQMKSMFGDEDGAVQNALNDADDAEKQARAFLAQLKTAPAGDTNAELGSALDKVTEDKPEKVASPVPYVRRALVVVSAGGGEAMAFHDNLNAHIVTIEPGVKPAIPHTHVQRAIEDGYASGEFNIVPGMNSPEPRVLVTMRGGVAYVSADPNVETFIFDYDNHPDPKPVIPEEFQHLAERGGVQDYLVGAAPADSDAPGM